MKGWALGLIACCWMLMSCEKDAVILPATENPAACGEWMTFVEFTPCHGLTFDADDGTRYQVWGLDELVANHPPEPGDRLAIAVTPWEPAIICMALPSILPIGQMVRATCVQGRPVHRTDCYIKVTYEGPHSCAGEVLRRPDGWILRAMDLQGVESGQVQPGDQLLVGIQPPETVGPCPHNLSTFELGTAVSITCQQVID